ncbi:MAG: ATP-binding protein [Hyphomonadaceae bacterium]
MSIRKISLGASAALIAFACLLVSGVAGVLWDRVSGANTALGSIRVLSAIYSANLEVSRERSLTERRDLFGETPALVAALAEQRRATTRSVATISELAASASGIRRVDELHAALDQRLAALQSLRARADAAASPRDRAEVSDGYVELFDRWAVLDPMAFPESVTMPVNVVNLNKMHRLIVAAREHITRDELIAGHGRQSARAEADIHSTRVLEAWDEVRMRSQRFGVPPALRQAVSDIDATLAPRLEALARQSARPSELAASVDDILRPIEQLAEATAQAQPERARAFYNQAVLSLVSTLLLAIAFIAGVVAMVWVIDRKIVRRITSMSDALERSRTSASPQPLQETGSADEIGALARRFQDLLDEAVARESALRDALSEAQIASEAKSAFLATMTHELRTPLNVIIGYSEMLREDVEDGSGAAQDLDRVMFAGRHLLGMISDILDLSKVESGKVEVHATSFDAAAELDAVITSLQPLAKQQQSRLSWTGPVSAAACTDGQKLRQCLYNLVANACKFTKEGEISVSLARVIRGDNAELVFVVRDTGIGMTPEQTASLFRPFAQIDRSITRQFGGAGLGLAITKRFSNLLGGDVGVESEPGVGSTFTLRLPSSYAPAAATHAPLPRIIREFRAAS